MSEETTQPAGTSGGAGAGAGAKQPAPHAADRPPTTEEDEAAERARRDPALSGDQAEVGEHYREMTERGTHQEGEGRIS